MGEGQGPYGGDTGPEMLGTVEGVPVTVTVQQR